MRLLAPGTSEVWALRDRVRSILYSAIDRFLWVSHKGPYPGCETGRGRKAPWQQCPITTCQIPRLFLREAMLVQDTHTYPQSRPSPGLAVWVFAVNLHPQCQPTVPTVCQIGIMFSRGREKWLRFPVLFGGLVNTVVSRQISTSLMMS